MKPGDQVGSQIGAQLLAAKGALVQGVAADAAAQAVIRIQANNVGDQFTLTLFNDQQPPKQSGLPNEDGALGNPGDTSFSQNQITVTAVATGNGPNGQPNPPFAFAVYRAPVDFARQISPGFYKSGTCGSMTNASNDKLACRSVTIQVQGPVGNVGRLQLTIVRPPVIFVHGLWGDPSDWNNFSPLFSNVGVPSQDSRFVYDFVKYSTAPADLNDQAITIVGSTPDYSSLPGAIAASILQSAKANALGFQFNAPGVLRQIIGWIDAFKAGANTQDIPVAAVQADIVAHSMGGDIVRTLPLQPPQQGAFQVDAPESFLSSPNFDQGLIHKLIAIDTPHFGSVLATKLLNGQNNCVATLFTVNGLPVFSSVQMVAQNGSFGPISGAVGDLVDSPQSQALTSINNPTQPSTPVRTALIAGTFNNNTNTTRLLQDGTATAIRNTCGSFASNELATKLTPSAWPTLFSPDNSDAIVGLSSQLARLGTSSGTTFDGNIHSPGTRELGFNGPSVLDAGPVPQQVITLLNTPITLTTVFNPLNP